MSSSPVQPGAGHRRLGWSLAVLALAQMIISLDLNIVFVALPEIGSGLGFSEQTLQWVVSAYTVFCGGFLLLGGRAADLFGRRRMLVVAVLLYAGSSLVGGLAWDPLVIIAARAAQGVGGALLFPATLSLINTLFEEGPRRNRALAVWGGAGASGLTLGSLLGGVLTDAFGWSAVFFVNVPLAGVVALAALAVIPRDEPRRERRGFDLPGAVTVTAGVTLLVSVLVRGPESGWGSTSIVVSAVLAVALLALFALVEARSADPLMPLRLFRNRSLAAGMTITFLYMGTFGALPYFLTVLFQNVHGYDAMTSGLAFLVPSLSIAAGTQLGERMATRMRTRTTLLVGLLVGVVGTVVMLLGFAPGAGYLVIVPGLVVSGVGQGITWTGMWIAAACGVAPGEQGVASGMASTTQNVGNAVGLAVLVAVANSGLGEATGEQLRSATADGMRVAVFLAAAGMVVGALVALALPRRPTSPPPAAKTPGDDEPIVVNTPSVV
ncbi:drug resistance transporter, EmrB/QacA subfamily [Streptoalloteichus tenebrarius]|uniref:Drug resistance transporter, EmrB/QacA subfamily n=1 Tax=Streptoalloteichus tenebrarius (strain ATCC 17920 / DSM 40477 / JCM 4838 / CBS 697.72 / NBRC 16177 / NCIMB 11028 / NRRL B-12390 / A12253. 1 / ISP 5477) TaxID=1933 RepID=A0ABT1HUM3_STRSD|nr:MFS transporter [Streptoalloteichus tenebrarius]MCP2259214.1 drug resistance transporter, EmrB/QacA subfamily [Streptoalloteichus tenebrarius]BFF04305.1 MFS transporter [Streptoalloteichus tenebrarius]